MQQDVPPSLCGKGLVAASPPILLPSPPLPFERSSRRRPVVHLPYLQAHASWPRTCQSGSPRPAPVFWKGSWAISTARVAPLGQAKYPSHQPQPYIRRTLRQRLAASLPTGWCWVDWVAKFSSWGTASAHKRPSVPRADPQLKGCAFKQRDVAKIRRISRGSGMTNLAAAPVRQLQAVRLMILRYALPPEMRDVLRAWTRANPPSPLVRVAADALETASGL